MEKHPIFWPKLSLAEMALRKLVVHFWSETDILTSIEKFPFKEEFRKRQLWQETVEDKVKDKISKLIIPESLKNRMNLVIKPIGLQIPEWKNFMEKCLCDSRENLDMHLLKHLGWTSAGTLDYGKTAEKIVTLQTLDVVKRFKLASGHCLVDSLPVVWKELPEEYKSSLGETIFDPVRVAVMYEERLLPIYWAYVLKGEEYKLHEIHRNFYFFAFASSAKRGNKAATEHFFQKLSNEERDSFLSSEFHYVFRRFLSDHFLTDFPQEKCTDVFVYLFSQMTAQQQMQILRDCPGYLFRIFLHWPWQHLFLEKTDLIWNFIPEGIAYCLLLRHMRKKIKFSDYYFPELFQEFFRRSPSDFREHFVNQECLGKTLFSKFLNNEDKETVKAILRNIDVGDRVRLVSCFGVFQCFDSLLRRKGHHLVELCVREAYPSKEDRERLKEAYMGMLTEYGGGAWREAKWQLFFESLDKTDASGLEKFGR